MSFIIFFSHYTFKFILFFFKCHRSRISFSKFPDWLPALIVYAAICSTRATNRARVVFAAKRPVLSINYAYPYLAWAIKYSESIGFITLRDHFYKRESYFAPNSLLHDINHGRNVNHRCNTSLQGTRIIFSAFLKHIPP